MAQQTILEGSTFCICDDRGDIAGDTSGLILDPDLDSYYLMNVVIFQGPELSEMLAQARGIRVLTSFHWMLFVPGLAIFVTVLAFNFFGDGLRDALDPRAQAARGSSD